MITSLFWFGWLVALAINVLVIYLFMVFGLAAAAGAPTTSFIWFTAACVVVALVLSMYLMQKHYFVPGIFATFLWFPIAAIVGSAFGYISNP